MDELDRVRELVEQPPPPPGAKERARQALRARIEELETTPRPTWFRLPAKAAVGLGAGAMVVLVVMMVFPGGLSAWSSVPTIPPDPDLVAVAPDECAGHRGLPEVLQPLQVVDQREDVALALFGERGDDGGASFTVCTLVWSGGEWRAAGPEDLGFDLVSTSGSVDEQLLGGEVDRVVIMRDNDDVQVSYANGFHLMWWPQGLALSGETMQFIAADGEVLLERTLRVDSRPPGAGD